MIAKPEPSRHAYGTGGHSRESTDGVRTSYRRLARYGAAAAVVLALAGQSAALTRQHSAPLPTEAEQQRQIVDARAAKDVDVASFYMHKGDFGAAIPRLEEAVQLDARNPKARLLLAESYEKQGNRTEALKTYRNYLSAFPDANDDKKIRKKIKELSRKRD